MTGKDEERNGEVNAPEEDKKHEIEAPISREDLLRSLDAELARKRPDNYIITQLCLDLGAIPNEYRPRVWKALLLSGKTTDVQCDIYMAIDPDDINQRVIRADAPRTRPKEFEDRAAVEHSLLHVLTFYCRAKNIRYKQGMNEVLAPFLLLLWTSNDEDNTKLVYQCFYTFIDKYLTNVYSDREFRSLQCSMRLLRLLLLYHDPRLCTYLDEHDMTPELYVTPWFMTLFARNTSPDIIYALWDAILLYDDPTLLHFVALSLLQDQRETLLKADAAELPQVLTSLGLTSVEHTQTLIQRALKTMQTTPSSFRRDVLTVCYKPLTDRTVSALKQIGNTSCMTLHPQELVSYMVQKVQGTLSTAMNMIILDCRSFQAFQEYHLSLSYHIDPDVVANAEAFRVLLDGFGRIKDCHFCFVGSKASAAMHSDGDPVLSPSQDHEILDDVSIGRFVMMFLQNGFQHVSKVQGGLEAIREEFLNTLDDSVHEQLIVGEWVDDATDTLKDKAKRLIGKLPTQSALQQFQRLKSTLGKQLSKQPSNDVSQNPLAGDEEWVEVVVKSKEVLRRSSKSLSEDWKTVVFQEGKLGILFKGVDRSAITIDSIVPHGQAESAKVLKRGDILETIDAASVRGLRFQAVMQMLQKTPRPVTLQFSRPPTRMFDTLDALSYPPHAPLLLRNGPYSLSIIWDHVPGATKYQLQYAMQSEYRFHPWSTLSIKNKDGQVLDHSTDANDASGTVVGLEPGEKYLLRVRCGTATNWGTYSEPSVAMTTLETSRKVQSPRGSSISSSLVVFLVGECPDVVEKGLFYYRVLIGLRARSSPSYDATTEEIALEKGSLIKCEEKIMRGPHVFVRIADTELWAFETTSDGAPVLERLAMEPFEKKLTPQTLVEKPVFVAPSGLHLQAASSTSIVVTWEALLDPTVTKYCIQFSKNKLAALWTTRDLVASENSCILTQLTPGTAYIVRVRAGYESGWGPYTATSAPCRTPDAPPGTPPSSTEELDDGKGKLFNGWMEKAAQTAAGAVQQVARLTRTNSMDQVPEERPIKEPPLVINVDEMKQAKEEFEWFPAKKLHDQGTPTPCELVVTNGYLLSVEPEENRPGWGRIDERRRLKLLTKITSRRTISNSVVFHFKQHEEEDNIDTIGFIVEERKAVKEAIEIAVKDDAGLRTMYVKIETSVDDKTKQVTGKKISLTLEKNGASVFGIARKETKEIDLGVLNALWFTENEDNDGEISSDVVSTEVERRKCKEKKGAEATNAFGDYKQTTKVGKPSIFNKTSSNSLKTTPISAFSSMKSTPKATNSNVKATTSTNTTLKKKRNVIESESESESDNEMPKFVKKTSRIQVNDSDSDEPSAKTIAPPSKAPAKEPTKAVAKEPTKEKAVEKAQEILQEKDESKSVPQEKTKRQRAVTKTRINEHGYMVNETVYEDVEEEEENEQIPAVRKPVRAGGKLPAPPPKKKRVMKSSGSAKQSNMMDFFGKK
ncbi:hypothetical protein THRCLA_00590 [Thraustotheca clavata]|uniref:TBC1 domain family member 23 n=1 Tax=Thraustotheca clavata TaxID=74557 RepID=A0A1W0AB38_9STRA|nr:hypothetical protein THRCLA_00590 [Thraustotheca clavata]